MKKFAYSYEPELQGTFKLKKLNLLLVFQVNCPGCFSYALPLFNKLYADSELKELGFLALSTAFEDFDKNTAANTKALIDHGTLIGETKKFLSEHGIDKLPYALNFPIAMDAHIEKTDDALNNAVGTICKTNPNCSIWADADQKMLRNKVRQYLNSMDTISFTFTLNQLRGTPSFILFNEENTMLKEWFGHVDIDEIKSTIHTFFY